MPLGTSWFPPLSFKRQTKTLRTIADILNVSLIYKIVLNNAGVCDISRLLMKCGHLKSRDQRVAVVLGRCVGEPEGSLSEVAKGHELQPFFLNVPDDLRAS